MKGLPYDLRPPAAPSGLRGQHAWTLRSSTEDQLSAIAREREVSPDQLLAAAFQYLLSRHNEDESAADPAQDDTPIWKLLTGIPMSGPSVRELDLTIDREFGTTRLIFDYSAELYQHATIERFARRYEVLAAAIAENKETPAGNLPILPQEERRLLFDGRNNVTADPEQRPLHELFELCVERHPNIAAISVDGHVLSYSTLNQLSNRLARSLVDAGVGVGDRIATLLATGPDQIVSFLATLKAGGVFVGLDPEHPSARLESIVAEAEPSVLVTTVEFLRRHQGLEACLSACRARLVVLDAESAELGNWPGATGPEDVARRASTNLSLPIDPSAYAYIAYTSGSTGRPKGIVQTHRSFAQFIGWQAREIGIGPGERFLQWASIGYDAAYCEILGSLCFGATLCLARACDRFNPRELAGWIAAERITILQVVPSFSRELLAALAGNKPRGGRLVPELRVLMLAGERLPVDLAEAWLDRAPDLTIYNLYGPSECVLATYYRVERPAPGQRSIPIGCAIDGRQILVLDRKQRLCPIGVSGEIYVRSRFLTAGYFKRPDETAARFIQNPLQSGFDDPVFRTGDIARWLGDGTIEFHGRSDSLVKLRGMRVELGDIEASLREHPGVADAVVLVRDVEQRDRLTAKAVEARAGVSGGSVRQTLVAYLAASNPVTETELRAHLDPRLPKHMIPNQFVVLDKLPRNANNKIDFGALPRPAFNRPERERDVIAPRDDFERTVAEIWQDCLALPAVGVRDNFFDLGGDSLLAMQVLNRISKAFGVRVLYRHLIEHETVAELADLLRSPASGLAPVRALNRAAPRKSYPLGAAQQGLWYLWNLEPASPFYNALGCIHLQGALDLVVFQRAWQAMLDRHIVVRTRLAREGGAPAIVFDESRRAVVLPVEDLTGLPEAEREAEVARRAKQGASRPFHLENDPLLRAVLYKTAKDRHELVFTYHEIILDLWAFAVMIRDLVALYDDFLAGKDSSLPPLEADFSDYLLWENEHIQRDRLSTQRDYWMSQLAGELPVLDLPIDRPRPRTPHYAGAAKSVMLDANLSGQLRRLSRQQGSTLFTTLLTAFKVLLHTYSGQDDLIVGTPIANRAHQSVEDLVGWFVNMLPIRSLFRPGLTFAELLHQVHGTVTGAISNSDYPFSWMLVDCEVQRDRSVSPIFQVMFNWQNLPQLTLSSGALEVSSSELDSGYKKYDLALYAQEHVDRIYLHMSYLSAIFNDETVERLLGNLVRILESVAADPAVRLEHLEICTPEEQHQLAAFSTARRDFGNIRSLKELFEERAAAENDRTAFIFGSDRLSYAQLNRRANRLAHRMIALGAGPGTVAAICAERSFDLVVAILAAVKTGATYVALDPAHPKLRLDDILGDTRPGVLVVQRNLEQFREYSGAKLLLEENEASDNVNESNPEAVGTRELLSLVYTSASTGQAKGVQIPERAILNRLYWMWDAYQFRAGDLSVFHKSASLIASTWELFGPLLRGVHSLIVTRDEIADPVRFFNAVASRKVTHLLASPPVIEGVLDQMENKGGRWPSLRFATTSAEPIAPALVRRWQQAFPKVLLLNLYGSTECCSNASVFDTQELAQDAWRVPIGRPIANVRIDVLSRGLKRVPIGAVGEMCVSGACLSSGYLNLPALTAEKFVGPGPVFRTGDLARYRANGCLEIVGRRDRQVNVRGFRVDLDDVENTLAACAGVGRAAVLLRHEGTRKTRLIAFVESKEELDPSVVRAFLKERLPEYMVPASVGVTKALPLTPSGKIDRRALEGSTADEVRPREHVAPRDDLELRLGKLWEELLEAPRIGIQDNFFDVGGHSLLAVHLVSLIEREFGKTISLADFFQAPTVENLARLLREKGQPTHTTALVPLRSGGARPPFFCICGVHIYRDLAENLQHEQPVYAIFVQSEVDAMMARRNANERDYPSVQKQAAVYVAKMRTVQPEGPYHFGGVSYGGLLAFEMAHQLAAAGHEVGLVAIIDTLLRDAIPQLRAPRFLKRMTDAFREGRERRKRIKEAMTPELAEAVRLNQIRRHIYRATAKMYELRPYFGRMVLFRAMDHERGSGFRIDPLLGWGPFARGPLQVFDVPGTHVGCLQPPHVQVLASRLDRALAGR